MTEAVLRARLMMLKRNLLVTQTASNADSTELVLAEAINRDAWEVAFGQVSQTAQTLLWRLDDFERELGTGMEIEAAWTTYRGIRDETQQTCRDCFELVGGFALREKLLESDNDQLLDRRVTAVTEAIGEVCRRAFDNLQGMIAVPAPEDAVSQTMARMVRARFPDWTVWTLPAAGYEYANVVLHQIKPIMDAIDKERRHRLRSEGLTDRSARGERRSAELSAHLTTLFADAFATRVMGPAYVAAIIVLRLDPLRPETDTMPSDRDRAATILAVVREAYPASGEGVVGADTEAPWRFVRDQVAPSWATLCKEAGTMPSKRVVETAEACAEAFMNRNRTALRNGMMPDALYPYDSPFGECWKSAGELAAYWKKDLLGEEAGPAPQIRGFRDVLNAAWICRVECPDKTELLTTLTRKACDGILQRPPRMMSTDRPDVRQSTDARQASPIAP